MRWTDRTESFVAGSDVRTCVPTRERLRAEAQAPAAKRARRVTESPRRVTESPQPRLPGPPALLPDEYARGAAAAPSVGGLRATPPVPRVPRYVGGVEQRTSSADTRAIAEYLRVCGAQDPKQLAGVWSFTYIARPSGGAASGRKVGDRYFHPPNGGKKLRSMAEVARWHGLSPSTSNVGGISDEEKRALWPSTIRRPSSCKSGARWRSTISDQHAEVIPRTDATDTRWSRAEKRTSLRWRTASSPECAGSPEYARVSPLVEYFFSLASTARGTRRTL